ncbi:ABC-2 type transport system permease protein [Streptoalloteichus tenebrarius]|uniref:ABC-2 type transport system permease protein n=1 Tax=Streptoalloteichus tenebrarius (strain ATCC 17920 / DSM 40477 / JCM 4838 / CBS 697.72 / NBRC 16177 / NCIMB 11028 / NRRL B-12390 / A12253. 1 / ISP 5477) TaxID=1933 RepID=A0ABT1HVD7_STRSD|nr:ABC transporter permease [Streptoalloteichus tenebrarius]MCP2259484.1 ABC-2 type transport system permease protein [Streptoalloteichus tenebrarius]BFF01436.1 ABC transporter permease [Streptoalloteichus tenebrarius]
MNLAHAMALGRTEFRLLRRNKLVASIAVAMPLVVGLALVTNGGSFGEQGWGMAAAVQVLQILLMTVYLTVTTALTARRQDLFLKRLRSGELSDVTILVGLVGPAVLLAVVQVVLLLGATVAVDATPPRNPLLVAAAVVLGAVMFAAAGMATTVFTPNPETAQITTMPVFLGAMLAVFVSMITRTETVRWVLLAIPGGGITELIRTGWVGARWDGTRVGFAEQLASALPALGASVLWSAVAVLAAWRWFRWEPRR